MKKQKNMSKKLRQKKLEQILIIALVVVMILGSVWGIVDFAGSDNGATTVTTDGHIHTADGQHIGTLEEIFGAAGVGATITEEGHIHAADGTELGTIADLLTGEADHEH